MQRVVWIWIGLLACALGMAPLGPAANAAYQWQTLHVDIELESSGDLLITETQRYEMSGQKAQRLQRTLPLDNVDRITDVAVFEHEQALAVKTATRNEQFRIRWRAPRQADRQPNETRTFVVRYRVQGGVRVHPDGDQIVWTALFGDRETSLPQGAVTLRVPSGLAGEIQHWQSYGVPAAMRKLDDRTLSFVPNAQLQPDETLKVKVVVPHGRLQTAVPKWQQGVDVPYALPGLLGRIDAPVLIVVGIGLFVALYYAISSTTYTEDSQITPSMGLDRDAGTYRPGDR